MYDKNLSLWRKKAIESLPSLRKEISQAEDAFSIAFALRLALESAYERLPLDEAFVKSIYEYAWWTFNHAPAIQEAFLVSFYGNIVRKDTIRQDMHRWLTPEQFSAVSGEFMYRMDEEDFAAFERDFMAASRKSH